MNRKLATFVFILNLILVVSYLMPSKISGVLGKQKQQKPFPLFQHEY
jgi:hypothetical protein